MENICRNGNSLINTYSHILLYELAHLKRCQLVSNFRKLLYKYIHNNIYIKYIYIYIYMDDASTVATMGAY